MKTVITTIVFVTLMMLPFSVFSQFGFTGPTTMDVRGVFIGGTYTRAQVQARWGAPTQYRSYRTEFWGLQETYDFGVGQNRNNFQFADNGVFVEFHIRTRDFPVYTAFSGGIRVGDNISRVQAIGLGTPRRQRDGTYWVGQGDDPLIFHVSSAGIITRISFMSSM